MAENALKWLEIAWKFMEFHQWKVYVEYQSHGQNFVASAQA